MLEECFIVQSQNLNGFSVKISLYGPVSCSLVQIFSQKQMSLRDRRYPNVTCTRLSQNRDCVHDFLLQ